MQAAAEEAEREEIRAAACPLCAMCGYEGKIIHSRQHDRLFGAEGSWNLKSCVNPDCGMLWLDPMPLPEEIGKAYARYYTHSATENGAGIGLARRVYRTIQRGYLAGKYGYQAAAAYPIRWLGRILYLFPGRRSEVDRSVRRLSAVTRGRLLDVGCGSGQWLAKMRELGWGVQGVDFDVDAVKAARQSGLQVDVGTVEEQSFAGESFHAITLNHVIEHVPNPVATLSECHRILKNGGKLVLFTPNASSIGHRLFGECWRGLEPPRHLHIFTPRAMRALLKKAGFTETSVRTHNSDYVIQQSHALAKGGIRDGVASKRGIRGWAYCNALALLESGLLTINGAMGECIEVVAIKR